jgi:hypothetical protein
MVLDRENKFAFSIKIGKSEITIPRECFIGIAGGLLIIGLLKVLRSL